MYMTRENDRLECSKTASGVAASHLRRLRLEDAERLAPQLGAGLCHCCLQRLPVLELHERKALRKEVAPSGLP